MTAVDTLKLLIKLQEIDRDLSRITSNLRVAPEILEKRSRHKAQLQAAGEAKHAEIMKERARFKESEVEMRTKEQHIEKLKAQLNLAKTNQEYQAILDQTKRVEEDRAKIEDAGLEILSRIDALAKEEHDLKAQGDQAAREFAEFETQIKRDIEAYRAEHDQVKQKRAALQAQVDRQALGIYERALLARQGVAIVPVEARICQGCYMTLTPNDLMNLQAANLVVCKSCQRLLYLPEVVGLAVR
ncbi:MAG: C4-type zinc ribbon domain-containing protein [Planctomycetota bacterium]